MQISDEVDLDPKIMYLSSLEMKPAEFYFLIDRSASMDGDPMETAKNALILFLHCLPWITKFNVISFGSNFESIFKGWVDYKQKTLDTACSKIKKFQANMEETEIYAPLHSIFENRDDSNGLTKHIFLLTDGDVYDPQQVIELIKNNSQHYYVHTFGIGSGASTDLIVGWANAGNGLSYFIRDSNSTSELKRYIIDALWKVFEAKLTILEVDLAVNGMKSIEFPQFEKIGTKLYHGQYLTYYWIIDNVKEDSLKGALTMQIHNDKENEITSYNIDVGSHLKFIHGDSIFKMCWKNYIKNIENKKENEDLITKLSLKYQVPSQNTSFIGKLF